MNKLNAVMSLCVLMLSVGGQAQTKYELSVKQAVDLAYKNVIQLKNAQLDYKIQEAKNREIVGMAFPQITGNVGANHYLQLPAILFPDATGTAVYSILKEEGVMGSSGPITEVPAPIMRQVSFQQPWNFTAGATLSQLLFQPDVFVGIQARQAALDLSASQIEIIKTGIIDTAYKRYYAILIAEKQLLYLNQALDRLKDLRHDDSIMYVNGFSEKLSLDKTQVQINNITTNRNQIAAVLNLSYASLKYALGISQLDTVVLKDDLSSAALRNDILVADFKYEDLPIIRTLSNVKKLQELDAKRYRLGYIPTVAAQANYTLNGFGQKFFTHPSTAWINSSFVGLNINMPIFDGMQRRSKVKQAELKVEQVGNNITNMKQVIDLEQVANRELLLTAINNLDIQEVNLALAEKVFNATRIKFEQGVSTFSYEVILAQQDLINAQSNYFLALYNAVVAKTNYLRSLGKLQ